MVSKTVPATHRLAIMTGLFLVGLWLEHKRPLRTRTESQTMRLINNLSLTAITLLILRWTGYKWIIKVAEITEKKKWGLLQKVNFSSSVKTAIALVLLDYALYRWHVELHRQKFLWRFHNVHHIDPDLDISTATRFHYGELFLTAVYGCLSVFVLGVNKFQIVLFGTCSTAFAQFHHSNVRLPGILEKNLSSFLVTPLMHGVHHSVIKEETASNFGIIFNLWDRLHQTLKLNIPPGAVVIGVPSYQQGEYRLKESLYLPYQPQREWKFANGEVPRRQWNEIKKNGRNFKARIVQV